MDIRTNQIPEEELSVLRRYAVWQSQILGKELVYPDDITGCTSCGGCGGGSIL